MTVEGDGVWLQASLRECLLRVHFIEKVGPRSRDGLKAPLDRPGLVHGLLRGTAELTGILELCDAGSKMPGGVAGLDRGSK
jgi:hypothetical protein